jgi:ssDNA-binding replication factor A large subunit
LKCQILTGFNAEKTLSNQPNLNKKDQELNAIQGIIVDVPKYGLIKRCNDCNRILEKGVCWEHGKVDGKYDLYIEANLFDGFSEHIILIEKPIIEKLFKIKLDQCIAIAMEYLDVSVIREMIKKQMVGRFYHIEGIYLAEGMKVKSIEIDNQIARMELLGLFDRWKMTEAKSISGGS